MNILVCVKQVVDFSVPLDIDAMACDICYDDVAWIANPTDVTAIRIATEIRARRGEGQVIALSLGPERADAALRKCLALGADQGVRVDPQTAQPLDTAVVASLLAAAARRLECSLVLCGDQAADTLSGQTGIRLSVALDWPVLSAITRIVDVENERSLVLQRRMDRRHQQVVRLGVPAVLTCEAGSADPPYPALPPLMRSLTARIEVLTAKSLGVNSPVPSNTTRIRAVGISPPKPRPKKIFTPDSSLSAADRIKQIMAGGLAQRRSEFLEGNSREVAIALVNQLRQRRII